MSTHMYSSMNTMQFSTFTSMPGKVLQRKCACGQHSGGGECAECSKKEEQTLQRAAVNTATTPAVPPIVHDVLNSSGQPLDGGTRAFMEPRFGHDFSGVKVHTDARAAESARAVNALAYTVGNNVVFGAGQYMPETMTGKRLLAHELTHVVQQRAVTNHSVMRSNIDAEVEAQQNAAKLFAGVTMPATIPAMSGTIQRETALSPEERKFDEFAIGLINLAQDEKTDFRFRAFEIVWKIIGHYYPAQASLVSGVKYESGLIGLETEVPRKLGPNVTSSIVVGDDFVKKTDKRGFARHVLQVGHELEHIQQFRTGIADKDEREFLAFYHEALATEQPHTGRFQHSTRIDVMNSAIGYYHCLKDKAGEQLQKDFTDKYKELVNKRQAEIQDMKSKGFTNEPEPAPTTCVRQKNQ